MTWDPQFEKSLDGSSGASHVFQAWCGGLTYVRVKEGEIRWPYDDGNPSALDCAGSGSG